MFLIKLKISNISVDSFSLYNFSPWLPHLWQIIETSAFLSKIYTFLWLLSHYTFFNRVFSFLPFLILSYWKYFSTILSFFSYSLGKNKLLWSNKLLPLNIKFINPIKKVSTHYWIICLYSINICFDISVAMNFLICFGICST